MQKGDEQSKRKRAKPAWPAQDIAENVDHLPMKGHSRDHCPQQDS